MAAVCNIADARCVDLHGMSVLEARAAVLCVLAMLQQQYRDTGAIGHDCTIITGRGRGSRGGEPVVRTEVVALLGRLGLPPAALAANPGRVVIPAAAVTEALRRKVESLRARQTAAALAEDTGGSRDPASADAAASA